MFLFRVKALSIFAAVWAFGAGTLAHAATLELVSSVPTNDAAEVARTDTLTLQFSAPLSAKSVNANTVSLQSAAGNQKAFLSVAGAVVSVRPSTPLLPWTNYTLNVSSLAGSNGDQLAAPITTAFQTRDATWQTPQLLYHLTPDQFNPVTRTNAKGVRFVAWQQTNATGTGDDIWAIRQAPGAATTGPTLVASFPANQINKLNIFVDDDGNAMATWVVEKVPTSPHTFFRIWANRFVAGTGTGSGWGTPQTIDWASTHANEDYSLLSGTGLRLVFDHAGNALAVWHRYDCCQLHSLQAIAANRYTRLTGWSKPVVLDDSYAFLEDERLDIQMDDAGNAYASWSMDADFHYPAPRRMVARYAINAGWSNPRLISDASTMYSFGKQALAVNPRGEAFLMWVDDDGLKYARADIAGSWSNPLLIDSTIMTSPSQMVLLDDGEAFAAFANGVKNFIPAKSLWSWTHPLLTNQDASSDPHIVTDSSGNALVAWTQTVNGVNRIYAKRYRANRGWFASTPIDESNTLGAVLQDLFLEPDGNVVATWLQNNDFGTEDVVSARFE